MLPLHGQATAAVEEFTGQNIPPMTFQEAMFLLNSQIKVLSSSFHRYNYWDNVIIYLNFSIRI